MWKSKVNDVFPFMRVHILKESLQPSFPDITILILYPSELTATNLSKCCSKGKLILLDIGV